MGDQKGKPFKIRERLIDGGGAEQSSPKKKGETRNGMGGKTRGTNLDREFGLATKDLAAFSSGKKTVLKYFLVLCRIQQRFCY